MFHGQKGYPVKSTHVTNIVAILSIYHKVIGKSQKKSTTISDIFNREFKIEIDI